MGRGGKDKDGEVLESGRLQAFWEVMLEGCLVLMSQAELAIILLGHQGP